MARNVEIMKSQKSEIMKKQYLLRKPPKKLSLTLDGRVAQENLAFP